MGLGEDRSIKLQKEIRFPHSLGLLYSAFTYFTGFKVNSGEYKVMVCRMGSLSMHLKLEKN